VRFVPAPRLRRLRLTGRPGRTGTGGGRGGGGRRQRGGQLFRVAEVAVRQARVQVTDLKVHGPLAQQITAFFFPVDGRCIKTILIYCLSTVQLLTSIIRVAAFTFNS